MYIEALAIPEVKIVKPRRIADHRGFFSETYHRRQMLDAGIDLEFVQDNHSFSAAAGTLRGLHFQIPPYEQAKLVRVVRGRILDVAVDIRKGSPTFGRYVSAEISAAEWNQIFVPVGFAHGFVTLDAETEVLYKMTNYYAPECDKGLLWSDPRLDIAWNYPRENIVLSAKDRLHPTLDELPDYFRCA